MVFIAHDDHEGLLATNMVSMVIIVCGDYCDW